MNNIIVGNGIVAIWESLGGGVAQWYIPTISPGLMRFRVGEVNRIGDGKGVVGSYKQGHMPLSYPRLLQPVGSLQLHID